MVTAKGSDSLPLEIQVVSFQRGRNSGHPASPGASLLDLKIFQGPLLSWALASFQYHQPSDHLPPKLHQDQEIGWCRSKAPQQQGQLKKTAIYSKGGASQILLLGFVNILIKNWRALCLRDLWLWGFTYLSTFQMNMQQGNIF